MPRRLRLLALLVGLALAESVVAVDLAPVEVTPLPDIPLGTAVKGRDGGYSVLVGGRFCMMFGDTLLTRPNSAGTQWVVNTMYHTADMEPDDGLAGGFNYPAEDAPADQWIPCTPAEIQFNNTNDTDGTVGIWPGSAFRDPVGGGTYVFTMKVIERPGVWPTAVGMGLARLDSVSSPAVRMIVAPGAEEETILFTPAEGEFGNMSVVAGDFVYAYCGKGESWGDTRIARAPLAGAGFLERARWQFWDGAAWQEDPARAAVITQGAPMGVVFWSAHLGAYLMTYMQVLGDEVKLRSAPAPEGPWSEAVVAFKAERGAEGSAPYGALAHPLLSPAGRDVYITYNLPGTWATGSRVPFVRVRLGGEPRTESSGNWPKY